MNCYRRSSAEHEPYDTTEVCHLRPGNSQRAAYVYIAYFSEKMEDKVGGTFDERVGRTQLLSRCVFLRRRSQISSVTGGVGGRVGHADASADAHRMRINAHRCASSAYCAKNDIPFFTYKLPFWLRFSKSLGPEPHQLTNILVILEIFMIYLQSIQSSDTRQTKLKQKKICFYTMPSASQTKGGEKHHRCPMCNYSFNSAALLKIHILVHTGEKPFSCNQCEYK